MHQGGNNSLLVLVILIGAPFAYYWLQVARRKREVIRFKMRRAAVYVACVLVGVGVIPSHGYSKQDAALFSMFVGLSAAFILIRPPRNDRRIPQKVRRAVIARDLKGERFDPNLHDVDHIVPFSKGGDHSEANLRVLSRSENRRRGAKMPKFRDLL
jgi:hypothetical protein